MTFRLLFLQNGAMKTTIRIGVCVLLLFGLSAAHGGPEKVETQITILVPEKGQNETILKINDKLLAYWIVCAFVMSAAQMVLHVLGYPSARKRE